MNLWIGGFGTAPLFSLLPWDDFLPLWEPWVSSNHSSLVLSLTSDALGTNSQSCTPLILKEKIYIICKEKCILLKAELQRRSSQERGRQWDFPFVGSLPNGCNSQGWAKESCSQDHGDLPRSLTWAPIMWTIVHCFPWPVTGRWITNRSGAAGIRIKAHLGSILEGGSLTH